jgi:geranylgeranyl diphosphate synthase, type I
MGQTPGAATKSEVRPVGGAGPAGADLGAVRGAIDDYLYAFLNRQSATAVDGRLPSIVTGTLRDFVRSGGKRLRPVLCVLGHLAAGGETDAALVGVAASLELFHTYALIHDDVMDDSDLRRGRPTVHRALYSHYRDLAVRRGDRLRATHAARFGVSGAILLGDIALAWSDAMLNECGLADARLAAVRRVIDAMRIEVMYGQWLDVHTLGRPDGDLAAPLAVARYKSAKYTYERPLHLGAVLAGAGPGVLATLSRYALPVGEAFQLQDDLLGVFGDPAVTGKSASEDLREGKRTVLIAVAHLRANAAQRSVLKKNLGNRRLDAAGAERIRQVLLDTGAVQEVERLITERCDRAWTALDGAELAPGAAGVLRQVAQEAALRVA